MINLLFWFIAILAASFIGVIAVFCLAIKLNLLPGVTLSLEKQKPIVLKPKVTRNSGALFQVTVQSLNNVLNTINKTESAVFNSISIYELIVSQQKSNWQEWILTGGAPSTRSDNSTKPSSARSSGSNYYLMS